MYSSLLFSSPDVEFEVWVSHKNALHEFPYMNECNNNCIENRGMSAGKLC